MAGVESSIQKLAGPVRLGRVMQSRTFERYYPRLGALAVLVFWWRLGCPVPGKENFGMALVSSLTLAAIFTGFVGTATAVMIGMDSPVMEKIRKTTAAAALASYVTESIVAGMAVAITAFLAFFWAYPPPVLLIAIWVFFIALLALSFFRISYIMVGFLGVKKRGN
jgi:hypothetical protein